MNLIDIKYKFKRLFCNHNQIRYWGYELYEEYERKYKVYTSRCEKCGLDFVVRERI